MEVDGVLDVGLGGGNEVGLAGAVTVTTAVLTTVAVDTDTDIETDGAPGEIGEVDEDVEEITEDDAVPEEPDV